MVNRILQSFEIWTDAQGLKSKGRVKSVDNISLEGIARLRELILELSIKGKLVSQNIKNEHPSKLLEKIVIEKNRLAQEQKIDRESKLPPIKDIDVPHELPNNWIWCRFADVVHIKMGQSPPSSSYNEDNKGVVLINGPLEFSDGNKGFTKEIKFTTSPTKMCDKGDLILCIRASIGRTNIATGNACIGRGVAAIKPIIDLRFIHNYILANSARIYDLGTGTTFRSVSKDPLREMLFPLPPIEEQKLIVAKVDELMALCDKLEAQQTNNLKTHEALVKTLLETLTQATNAGELQTAWARLSTHFDTLFCTENSIDLLKQTILQLAVMGKLVKQDPNDEPASELLKKIAKEKEKLVKEGKIKKEKALPEITEDEKSIELPKEWEWARLQDVTLLITDGKHGDCQNQLNSGYYFLSAKDIQEGKLNYEFAREINFNEFQETHRRTDLKPGDICMVNTGATVGKLAIAEDDPKTYNTTFQKSVAVIKPVYGYLYNKYLRVFLLSETQNMIKKSGGSAINNLLLGDLKKKVLPIPPLAEQNLIVSKVEELFTLCDTLKEKLIQSQEIKGLLARAVVEGAVG
jgi:type I restriction enzyme S subunit